MENLPKVIIFEGGDVCGKSTQLNYFYNKLKENDNKVFKFKFPNKYVKIDDEIERNNNDLVPSYFCVINKNDNNEYSPYDLFNELHKTLYKYTSLEEIIENWDYINNLIMFDIVLNGYDKFNWVKTEYREIVENDPDSAIFIDRFIDSGSIYNIMLPNNYISNFIINNTNPELKDKIKDIKDNITYLYKYSEAVRMTIWNTIDIVNSKKFNKLNEYNFFDEIEKSLRSIKKLSDDEEMKMDYSHTNNIYTIYFESSQILYSKFKSEIESNEVNREVSQYDTNDMIRYILSLIYNFISGSTKDKYPDICNIVSMDIMLTSYKLFNKDPNISSEEYIYNKYFKKILG